MKIIRSWPDRIPGDRNYVVDTLPRFLMTDYSYRGLGDLDDDILLIEWDMAISSEDLSRFATLARKAPDSVLVAPYRLYQGTATKVTYPRPMWAMRRYNPGEQSMRFVDEHEPTCHMWGLGVTYLPRDVIRAFLDAWPGHFSDTSLSGWHYRNVEAETPIAWDVRPIHLHYPIERIV